MESLLGFEDTSSTIDVEKKSSNGHKLVPWLNWEEWDFVKDSLFSSLPQSVSSALNRISAWRSRGCLPVAVEVTAPVIEIQQKDPFFREDDTLNNLHSEEMLAMLYSMAIMRFVNVVVEKTRKHTQASIAEAADMVGIPRMLIDIRHEGAHRDLPSLRLLRLASVKVLDWLKYSYWEPQKNIVTFQGDSIAKIRKEIKSRLHELTLSLKVKGNPESTSPLVKAKRVTQPQQLSGRNKLSLMAGKPYSSKSVGSKKQTRTTMKHLLRLHSSFSSEVVSVLLEYLLKATDSEDLVEAPPKDSQGDSSLDKSLFVSDDLKLVVTKLSKKEPKLLLALLNAALDMIQTQRDVEYEIGEQHLIPFEYSSENHQTERLSLLFAWLVRIQKIPKLSLISGSLDENEDCSTNTTSKETIANLIRKSLLVLPPDSEHLMGSILHLAQMTGDKYLSAKLNKISLLNVNVTEENSSTLRSEDLIHQEDHIRGAAHKLEVLKLRNSKTALPKTIAKFDVGKNNKWKIAKSWTKCPIGMLPSTLGSSGRLPSLESHDGHDNVVIEVEPLVVKKELKGLNQYGKREARDIELLDSTNVKKIKETVEQCEIEKEEDDSRLGNAKGQLMINGVWRGVTEEELLAISSGAT